MLAAFLFVATPAVGFAVDPSGRLPLVVLAVAGALASVAFARRAASARSETLRAHAGAARAEEALRESERRFRHMADEVPAVIWMDDAEGRPLFVNRRWFELTGRPQGVADPGFYDAVHPDDVERVRAAYAEARARGAPLEVEYRVLGRAGDWRWVLDRAVPRFDEARRYVGIFGVAVDVTERRAEEARAGEHLRLEAVGRLAGGVAHDFNNLLTVILGHVDRLERDAAATDAVRREADGVRRAAEFAATLVARLLTFARRNVEAPARVDLKTALAELDELVRRLAGDGVRVDLVCAPDVGAVALDVGRLTQILVNLAVNARQAMPRGGRLGVDARRDPDDPRLVRLTVEDDGAGMTDDVKARLFTPFFTTKGTPANVGIGLATVAQIVRQAGGTVEAESAPGRGARFVVRLPRLEPDGTAAAPAPRAEPTRRGALVLLAEDDDLIRRLARRYLAEEGYEVADAGDGEAALAVAASLPRAPDVLVTDVTMPKLAGGLLAERLLERFPRMKVIFISGYTDDVGVRQDVSLAEHAFLSKPFSRPQLVRKVRETLAGPPADEQAAG
ncbi:MAG TPA: ATP-binding protein [Planctomycetota bacterium]|nr:ATP-binding protein [Planctomycetota bacterium]